MKLDICHVIALIETFYESEKKNAKKQRQRKLIAFNMLKRLHKEWKRFVINYFCEKLTKKNNYIFLLKSIFR